MELIYLFFIAVINSVDNMGIGIAYSIAGVKVQIGKNIIMSLMAFLVSYISSLTGGIISNILSEETSTIVSMLLLVSMGIKMIFDAFSKRSTENSGKVKSLNYKQALLTGTALAIDDIGSSVSSGLLGYSALLVSIPYFIVSLAIFLLANYGTKFFTRLKIGNKAAAAAGLLMILVGLSQFAL